MLTQSFDSYIYTLRLLLGHLELRQTIYIVFNTSSMSFPTAPRLVQTLRLYSQQAGPSKGSAFGVAAMMGYCCIAFSAPFAGAAVVSHGMVDDKRYAKL